MALVRKPAPAWSASGVVPSLDFADFKSEDLKGKYYVLFWYPLDWTFVCPTEIVAFNDYVEKFREIGCEVFGISVDSKHSHLAWIQTPKKAGGLGPLKFPLLADVSKSISKSFGVLIENEADPDFGVALRATAIVDPKGILRSLSVNDLPVGRNPDEVLRQVQGFKFTDETGGQVCPAGWRPGKKTMANKPKESKEYFASAEYAGEGAAGGAASGTA